MNITNTRNDSLLSQTVISNNLSDNTVEFNQSLQTSVAQECNTLRISVSAVSSYGESEHIHIEAEILTSELSHTRFF